MRLSIEKLPEIMKQRADIEVPQAIKETKDALKAKDFQALAPVIM